MGNEKSRMDHATMTISFTNDVRAFDANHPITGTITVDSRTPIPAYGIQLKLELIDYSKEVDHGDKGQRYEHIWKRKAFERCEMLYCF